MKSYYEPKLNIGDKIWLMINNKPVEVTVLETTICYGLDSYNKMRTSIKHNITFGHSIHESTDTMSGDVFYRTKAELIASL